MENSIARRRDVSVDNKKKNIGKQSRVNNVVIPAEGDRNSLGG